MHKTHKPTHFIFWRYDLYPGFLGAPGYAAKFQDCTERNKGWYIPSYQFFVECPLHVMPLDEGALLWEGVSALRGQYRERKEELGAIFMGKIKAFCPWAVD